MRYGTKTRTLVLEHMNLFLAVPNSTFILPTPPHPTPYLELVLVCLLQVPRQGACFGSQVSLCSRTRTHTQDNAPLVDKVLNVIAFRQRLC